jgi:TPR repeat protein
MRALLALLMACGTPAEPPPTAPCGDLDGAGCLQAAAPTLKLDADQRGAGMTLLEDACNRLQHGPACSELGRVLLAGGQVETPGDPKSGEASPYGTAIRWLELGCKLGDGGACYGLGKQAMKGFGVPKSEVKAAEWFGLACDVGHTEGCVDAGILAETGRAGVVDGEAAVSRYRAACQAGDGRGCTKLGLSLRSGLAGEPDGPAGVAALEEGCAKGFGPGCGLAALAWERGEGVTPDPTKRRDMLVAAVALDDRIAARSLIALVRAGGVGDDARGPIASRLEEACAADVSHACAVAGELVPERRLAHWTKGCDKGAPMACGDLAVSFEADILADGGKEALAVLHQRGCGADVAASCLWLGKAYETGVGVELVDYGDAVEHYSIACKLGHQLGCAGAERAREKMAAEGRRP